MRRPYRLLVLVLLCAVLRPATALDVRRPAVKQFIAHVAQQGVFTKRQLRTLLANAQSQPSILEAMEKRAEHVKLWYEYRAIFLTEKRIQDGADFWIAHREDLLQASETSGVAPEYIVGILGVETSYGRTTGHYRVLDALSTLAFDYPPRAKFFQDELEAFLLLSREAAVDPLTATGSYAGAMGAPQFMPSNYRRYAVDASKDSRIDLWSNWLDIFASVGNYFREHGWKTGEAVLSEATVEPELAAKLDGRTLLMEDTVSSLQDKGVHFDALLPAGAAAQLIAADEADGAHWRVGYQNFYVITRYNHSMMYAMAVYDLAQAVRARVAAIDAGLTQAAPEFVAPPLPAPVTLLPPL